MRVGAGFRLSDTDTRATPGYEGRKSDGERDLASAAAEVDSLQEKLFANSLFEGPDQHRSILLVLQGMDSSGKGGIVRHVVGSVDPGGVTHASFKKPTDEELSHDFLWRIRKRLPADGQIGVFDRSHYEDVLAGRVLNLASPEEIDGRYGVINDFERELTEQGTTVVKVFLNISPDEQKARLGARLERPDKQWKYNPNDIDSRLLWNQYQDAYQVVFDRTSTEAAPWHVVPADHKWYARLAVQRLVLDALQHLHQSWPPADYDIEVEKARLAAS
ncbi:phosphate--nucleotide phosphotransferase [Subtercola boreus]|uniref:Phosphate--nucleotide phosphotransferase n=1 Tax=Subtercola boreus TaxID=120213 RepID=A0A3E0W412_9MICO|nr:PPK2 family polyphosphate kinase [Subtercola boreus]RFA17104.1 phosphate--nucleotide phosphotransferase [Subtercola boreus]